MLNIINLTPHKINVIKEGYNQIIEPSGKVIRLEETCIYLGNVNGINVVKKEYGYADYIPPVVDGTLYIVSGLVASAMRRSDFLVPNTIRDENGQIIGCDSFSIIVD